MRLPWDAGGYWFECDPRDAIAREVCFTGRYEPQETALVRTILRPGMSFVDVGANWGYFTLLAAWLEWSDSRPDNTRLRVARTNRQAELQHFFSDLEFCSAIDL